jgi:hypothetical protein
MIVTLQSGQQFFLRPRATSQRDGALLSDEVNSDATT